MTLKEKMERWRELQSQADLIADEIKKEVMQLQQTIRVDGAVATYGKGRGFYDYPAIAKQLEPDEEIVQRHSIVKVDWRKVVMELGASDELKKKFYTAGKPYVSLKLK